MKLEPHSNNNNYAVSEVKPTLIQILRRLLPVYPKEYYLASWILGFIINQMGLWKICEINDLLLLAKLPAQGKPATNVSFFLPFLSLCTVENVFISFRSSQPEVWMDMRVRG